jgi:hypothetical protein
MSPRGYNQRASSCQENPNESKENQGKILAFPWIPLAESGLFNGLRRIQIKNFFSDFTRVTGWWAIAANRSLAPTRGGAPPRHWPRLLIAEQCSNDFCLIQGKSVLL